MIKFNKNFVNVTPINDMSYSLTDMLCSFKLLENETKTLYKRKHTLGYKYIQYMLKVGPKTNWAINTKTMNYFIH